MQTITCSLCGAVFQFDPKDVWTSPGTIKSVAPNKPASVAIQCQKCKQWIMVELKPDGSGDKTGNPP